MKFTITVGIVDGKAEVIHGPEVLAEEQIASVRKLTESNGLIPGRGKAGKDKQVSELMVVHSSKGILKRRKF